jgi:BON domain
VDTDEGGVVWLSGTARTQEAIDKAVSIATQTEHVTAVRTHIKIRQNDRTTEVLWFEPELTAGGGDKSKQIIDQSSAPPPAGCAEPAEVSVPGADPLLLIISGS